MLNFYSYPGAVLEESYSFLVCNSEKLKVQIEGNETRPKEAKGEQVEKEKPVKVLIVVFA